MHQPLVRPNLGRSPSTAQDSRGIIDPGRFQQRVTLTRFPPGPALAGLIEFFWLVSYQLPEGTVHSQQLITHPCVNLSVAHGQVGDDGRPRPLEATLTGVPRRLYTRRIAGTGWAVAAKSTPGGFGAFVTGSVADLTDRVIPPSEVLDLDDAALVAEVASAKTELEQVAVLEAELIRLVEVADPSRRRTALEVAQISAVTERDRSIRTLADLAAASGIGARTLQRLFNEFAGISPTWVLRRYRLLDVAESVRHGQSVVWAQVAADLGYSDQAHLVRDFRSAVGTTPAAYAAAQHGT
jgi:AraC-like DNA-binding protein